MTSAFKPSGGYPRLIRFCSMPGVLATLDKEQNVLRIDRDQYALLTETQKHMLKGTHEEVVTLQDIRSIQ